MQNDDSAEGSAAAGQRPTDPSVATTSEARADAATRRTVVVAGAGGFVGSALCDRLVADHEVIGLSRSPRGDVDARGVRWRQADLYSLLQTERALAGGDVAIYLVHSMMPSARLTQARFEDLDLILADNFGRAAARAGVSRIVYLGGLVPDSAARSRHLESRREVEDALGAHGVAVTTLRAGLVVGAGGSSLAILTALVKRLPIMVTPAWTQTHTHPIALTDLLDGLVEVIDDPRWAGETLDVGGPEVLTYREMMRRTAAVLGRRRWMVPVPLITPRLSALWVSLVTGTSTRLVGPLIESLRHPMVARDDRLMAAIGGPRLGFEASLTAALHARARRQRAAGGGGRDRRTRPRITRTARSVQRLPVPPAWDAMEVARAYMRWLPAWFRPLLRVEQAPPGPAESGTHAGGGEVVCFMLRGWQRPLLRLAFAPSRSTADRALFYVTGGALSRRPAPGSPPGRLEFRVVHAERPQARAVLAALHDFRPRLPWGIYRWTQAVVHRLVMEAFGRWLTERA